MSKIRPTLLVGISLEDFPSHKSPWCASACEKLELCEALFWEEIQAVHRDPAAMGFSLTLAQ